MENVAGVLTLKEQQKILNNLKRMNYQQGWEKKEHKNAVKQWEKKWSNQRKKNKENSERRKQTAKQWEAGPINYSSNMSFANNLMREFNTKLKSSSSS